MAILNVVVSMGIFLSQNTTYRLDGRSENDHRKHG